MQDVYKRQQIGSDLIKSNGSHFTEECKSVSYTHLVCGNHMYTAEIIVSTMGIHLGAQELY